MDFNINPIKVTVQYSYDEYKKYFIFSLFRGKLSRIGKKMFFIVYPILILLITILAIISEFDTTIVICDIVLISIFTFFIFYMNYYPKKYYKDYEKLFTSEIFFEFRNIDFTVNQSNNLYSGESKIKYEALYKIYETKSMFYIFIAQNQAFIINKSNFADGNLESFRTILHNNVDKKKFIKCFNR